MNYTVRRYLCLCCDGKRGDGTLRRLRPHKIYVCQSCVTFHCGIPAVLAKIHTLIQEFNSRRSMELAKGAAMTNRETP